MLKKPSRCFEVDCPLAKKGFGYAPSVGPERAQIVIIGEALGHMEAIRGEPFVGEAGTILDRLLRNVAMERGAIRIDNTVRCKPPNNWLDGAPWEDSAVRCCHENLDESLNAPGVRVVVPMGGTAIRRVLGIDKRSWRSYRKPMENFHGTIHRDPLERFWVVPTFHPSYIQRGNMNLMPVVMHDLLIAKEIVVNGYEKEHVDLRVDPPIEFFMEWVRITLEKASHAMAAGEAIPWLACDIETPEKEKGVDESEIEIDDPSFVITRVNLATDFDTNFALTVPWSGPYISGIAKLLKSPHLKKAFWNCPTPDQKVLTADLRWVEAGSLKLGDKLVGFDEEVVEGRRVRRYKESKVTMTVRAEAHVFEVVLSDGTKIKVSENHPWLLRPSSSQDNSDSFIGRRFKWVTTKNLEIGTTIQRLFNTWSTGDTLEHGYLSGIYDGEGSLSIKKSTQTLQVQFSQALGKTYNKTAIYLANLNYNPAKYTKNNRIKDAHVGQIYIGGRTEDISKFLGEVRPQRLLDKFEPKHLGALQTLRKQDVKVVEINDLGQQEVVVLSTDERTYVLEGFGAHNCNYDRPRLNRNRCKVCDPWYDIMDGWHMLHSSLPRGLGFVSPFYSRYGAWKHLSASQPGIYAAVDALQTIRCAVGIEEALRSSGQWTTFERHAALLDRYALKPAEDVGILINKERINEFQKELQEKKDTTTREIREIIPDELVPLEPKNGYKREPVDKKTKQPLEGYFEKSQILDCYKCLACGKVDITVKHRCKERKIYEAEHGKKPFSFGEWEISKWYTLGEFNPESPKQVLGYIKWRGHKPGKTKQTQGDSADADTLEKLEKKHKDPFYTNLLTLRKIDKIKGTYVDGAISQMDEKRRVHPVFTNKPSTWRTSCQGFNLQNVVSAGKREDMGLGEKFRKCVVPAKGCVLLEADYAGIEAVEVGWFANDPTYIRLAKMSTHAFITTHMSGFKDKVAQINWEDDELREYLSWVKHEKQYKLLYNRAKRVVHGTSYGLTARGLYLTYPDDFPSVTAAQKVIDLMFDLFPLIKSWQSSVRQRAHEQHYLGGEEHPFRYKHWFWNVFTFKKITEAQRRVRQTKGGHCAEIVGRWYAVYPGDDSKKCIAFYPQSTSGGVLREALLRLFTPGTEWYIGDVYHGRTPFRMPIHDSIVLEVPEAKLDYTVERLYAAMALPIEQQPCPEEWGIGSHLTVDVDMEIGKDWGSMETLELEDA